MKEIICPHCDKAFKVDEAGYADIQKQVRDAEFESEIHNRLQLEQEKHDANLRAARAEEAKGSADDLAKKDIEIEGLKTQLKATDDSAELKQQVAIIDAITPVKKDLDAAQKELTEQKSEYQVERRLMEKELEQVRDHKAKLSTKMLGETLEQHCEIAFNQMRATAFPLAYFEKDTASGKKGDYIYRDYDQAGTEFISIMFDMKNEGDETKTKKKNEDFLKKLDEDRNEKGCEYAILVSVLESDNELYNQGIVEKSHRYPKMYVVRPQFFIPIISVLHNAALNTLKSKSELELMKRESLDITNFEGALNEFKGDLSKRVGWAKDRYEDAIKDLDKSIAALQSTRANLVLSAEHLEKADNKAEGVTIKTLTRGNPTMAAKFADVEGTQGGPKMSEHEDMTVAELKDVLGERGLPLSGKKADLIGRLLEDDSTSGDEEDEE
jgi:hypothetical protein